MGEPLSCGIGGGRQGLSCLKLCFSKNLQIAPIFSYGVIYLMGVNLILLVLALLPSAL